MTATGVRQKSRIVRMLLFYSVYRLETRHVLCIEIIHGY